MIRYVLVAVLLTGCAATRSVSPPPAIQTAPVPVAPPIPPPRSVIVPVDPGPSERTKRITAARADLKTGLTSLELRGITACADKASEACLELGRLADQARALDVRLAAALVNPALDVDWPTVTATLRAIVDKAMKKEDTP